MAGGRYTLPAPILPDIVEMEELGYLPRKRTEAVLIPYPRLPGFSLASAG